MKELTIRQQLDAAFALRPDIDGILHGLRRIKQGKHGSRSLKWIHQSRHFPD